MRRGEEEARREPRRGEGGHRGEEEAGGEASGGGLAEEVEPWRTGLGGLARLRFGRLAGGLRR